MTRIPSSFRRALVAGGAVLVLGGAAVGIAAAQAQPATQTGQPSTYQKFLDALAKNLGVDRTKLEPAISQARVDAGLPAGNGFPGGERGGSRGGGGGFDLNALATFLGLQPQDLRTQLQTKSLAAIAVDQKHTRAELLAELKKEATTRIDAAATAGKLTPDQANQQKAQLDQRLNTMVDQVMPQRGPGGPGGPRGGGGFDLNGLATFLGLQPQDLRTRLQTKSLAAIAVDQKHTRAEVLAELKKEATARIDAAATAGRLTPDQANQQKAQLDQRLNTVVDQVMPQRGPGRGADGEDPNG